MHKNIGCLFPFMPWNKLFLTYQFFPFQLCWFYTLCPTSLATWHKFAIWALLQSKNSNLYFSKNFADVKISQTFLRFHKSFVSVITCVQHLHCCTPSLCCNQCLAGMFVVPAAVMSSIFCFTSSYFCVQFHLQKFEFSFISVCNRLLNANPI